MHKNIIIFSLIILIITGATWAGFGLPQKIHALAGTQSNLAAEQSRVLALETTLASTKNELSAVETTVSTKTAELNNSQQALARTTDYMAMMQSQLEISQYQINLLREQLATAQTQQAATTVESDNTNTPRPFNSVQEAESWLDENHLPTVLIAGQNGAISFTQPLADPRYDCDDYARDYQQLALKSGYVINLCPVIYGRVWGISVSNLMEAHIGGWVQIDNIYYYIECVPGLDNSYQLTRITSAD
jgi:hypothetical protein